MTIYIVVALYGGGKYLQVSHEFFLNGHTDNPYCEGVEGILSAYKHSLNTVQLYGPTNFAPIINHVARLVLEKGGGGHPALKYLVLVLLRVETA